MELSIIIVNYNVYQDVIICISSIYKYLRDIDLEIIVVDNNSSDRSIVELNNVFKNVKLILLPENMGFGAANNAAMKIAKGKFFFLVNPDIIFNDGSPLNMLEYIKTHENIGAIGPVQIKPGLGIEYYYTFFPSLYSRFAQEFFLYMTAPLMRYRFFKFWDDNIARNVPFKVDWVMGSALMVRSEIYEKTGSMDEAFFLYEEETEWQYR
ncbi:MAG: glycosyltransferase family 2 protein, partial [Ignavibacteria bacterium]